MIMNETERTETRSLRIMTWMVTLAAILLAGFALKTARMVFLPLAVTLLIVSLVYPVKQWFDRQLPEKIRFVGIALTMALIVIVLWGFISAIWFCMSEVAQGIAEYSDRFVLYWESIVRWLAWHRIPVEEDILQTQGVLEAFAAMLGSFVASLWKLFGVFILILFLVLLILIELDSWNEKYRKAFDNKKTVSVAEIFATISYKMRRFLLIRTVVSALSGILVGVWLWILGIDFALLWGVMTFLLNYIPYVGSIVAVFPPTIVALSQKGADWGFLVLLSLTIIDQVMGNYVDPVLEGKTLVLSPSVILFSIIFWTWVWGVAGTLLAVPLTIALAAVCGHIPSLQFIAVLVSRNRARRGRGS